MSQFGGPGYQGLGSLLQGAALDLLAARGGQTDGVFFVSPVQTHVGGEDQRSRRGGLWCARHIRCIHNQCCLGLRLRPRWLGSSEGLIVETSDCRHLSIRLGPKRRAGAKLSPNSSSETAREFVTQRGVTAELLALRQRLFTSRRGRRAKLFTVGCGERFRRLSSPPVNNFGSPIRVGVRGPFSCRVQGADARASWRQDAP